MPSYYLSEDLARFGNISEAAPKIWEEYSKFYGTALEDGKLDAKTKKIVALAVAFATQEPYCIDAYSSACLDAGYSPEQIAEAVGVVAAMNAGGVLAHWAQTCNTMARSED